MQPLIRGDDAGERRSFASAGLGAVIWLAAPWLPLGSPPAFGSIEHVFLSLPLTAAPLALALLSSLQRPAGGATHILYRLARGLQPVAAVMVLASFFVAKGWRAGALTAGWLLMALMIALAGVQTLRRRREGGLPDPSLIAAHLFLPVGAVWLLLSRLGVGPRSFSALTVFLAALHFHFSGFTLQIVIAATTRLRQERAPSRSGSAQRWLAVGAIGGIVLIALGNALALPVLKLAGVGSMVLSLLALAISLAVVALDARSRLTRGLLLVSAASIAAGMLVAGVYGVGELLGTGWIGVARMVKVHGLVNAFGFTATALIAHLLVRGSSDR